MTEINRWFYRKNDGKEYLSKVFEKQNDAYFCGTYIFDGEEIRYRTGSLKEEDLGEQIENQEGRKTMERWESFLRPVLTDGDIAEDIGERRFTEYIFAKEE